MKNLDYKRSGFKSDNIPSYGNGGSRMLNYSFKPEPTFIEKKGVPATCFFGIELEYECKNDDYDEDFNLFEFVEGIYRYNDFEKLFYTKKDSTFYGPEFVFQPISFLGIVELYRQGFWHKFFEMKEKFYKSTSKTGLHVHIDKDMGFIEDSKGKKMNQNMEKIAYSLYQFNSKYHNMFKSLTKRKSFGYCIPKKTIEHDSHDSAINETKVTYEMRFWASPVNVERLMYCLSVVEAIDIVSKSNKHTTVPEILKAIFYSIPMKIRDTFKVEILFPKEMPDFLKILESKNFLSNRIQKTIGFTDNRSNSTVSLLEEESYD